MSGDLLHCIMLTLFLDYLCTVLKHSYLLTYNPATANDVLMWWSYVSVIILTVCTIHCLYHHQQNYMN